MLKTFFMKVGPVEQCPLVRIAGTARFACPRGSKVTSKRVVLALGLVLLPPPSGKSQAPPSSASVPSQQTVQCWSHKPLAFPAGTRDAVLKAAFDFLIAVENLPEHPYWPKGDSGITIGVGWDIGQHGREELLATWGSLDPDVLAKLGQVVRKTGQPANALLPSLKSIEIPRQVALSVFRDSLAADYYPKTIKLLPGTERLPAEVQVALLSLVFNRGVLLGHDPDWRRATELDRRWEMRHLRDDVKRQDLFAIYIRLGTMKRLWEKTGPHGLLYRRRDEQHLIRPYVDEQLHWEEINDQARVAGRPPCPE